MSCINSVWPNVRIFIVITILFYVINNCAMQYTTNGYLDSRSLWIDERGLLKFENDLTPDECQLCPDDSRGRMHTEGSQVCYTAESPADGICNWSENIAEERSVFHSLSIRRFNVSGLTKFSITKYKIEQWWNIDATFVGLTDLEYLFLESNHITFWSTSDSQDQEPLTKLRVLSLANNPIANLSTNSFSWLEGSNLEFLNMRGCSNIKILDSGVFKPIANSKSLWLDLSNTILDPEQFSNLTAAFKKNNSEEQEGLMVLSLAHTGLYTMPTYALDNVKHSLQRLSLQGNHFNNCWRTSQDESTIDDCQFPDMNNLKEINLKDSGLTVTEFDHILNATPNLVSLYLDDNPLEGMSLNEPSNVYNISLRNIQGERGFLLCANGSKCSFPNLQSLDLSQTLLNITHSKFSDLTNLQWLSLRGSVKENIHNLLHPLRNLIYLDLSENHFNDNLRSEYFEGLSNLEELKLQSCFIILNTSLSPFVHLMSLKTLDMRNNFLRTLSKNLFNGLEKLQTIQLQANRIGSWNQRIFEDEHDSKVSLKTFNLQNNWITDITSAMDSDFQSISYIDLSYNPLSCEKSCKFFEYCKDEMSACVNKDFEIVLLNQKDPMAYLCTTENNVQRALLKEYDIICETPLTTEITTGNISDFATTAGGITAERPVTESTGTNSEMMIVVYISILMVPIVGAVFYWKRWRIIMCMRVFRRNMVMSMLKDTNSKHGRKESYQYDVFLSYSDRDREWILQQLIPNIEQRGHIKVCLHERDFEAGLPVLENIIACMDHSRCVLLVLSEAFLRSHWCQFELNLAQHRLLEMQHDRLILVLLENIPRDKCSKMLRYLMLTKTYVVWPTKGADEEKRLFWQKLKKAIGPVQDTVNVSFV